MTRPVEDPGLLFGHPVRHPNECPICKTFRKDGEPPTSHRFFCSEYVDTGVIRWVGQEEIRTERTRRAVR